MNGLFCGHELGLTCVPWNLYYCDKYSWKAKLIKTCPVTCVYGKGSSYCLWWFQSLQQFDSIEYDT